MTQLSLNLVNPQNCSFHPPTVQYHLQGQDLVVEFHVPTPVLHKKDVYGPKDFPYEFDVSEVFLTFDDVTKDRFSYFEYEITPLGQTYHLRLDVHKGHRTHEILPPIETRAHATDSSWSTSFRIPLSSFQQPMDLKKLRGNFYVILGHSPRTYWSTFLPKQDVANFHKPEFFRLLF